MEKIDEKELPKEDTERLLSNVYNEPTVNLQSSHEILNSAMNWHPIVSAIQDGRARDISDEPKALITNGEKMPAIIVGSGPSLDHSIPFLKDWQGGIFCSTSHALTLIRYGIQPTHIVALDPFCVYDEIEGIDWSKTRTKLIAHPGIYPSLIEKWPNEILLYIQNNGRENSFYRNIQKKMYTKREDQGKGIQFPIFRYYIKTEISLFACSPPMQLFAADLLGYGSIFLCGCDFGFPNNKTRFTSWTVKNKTEGVYHNDGYEKLENIISIPSLSPNEEFDASKWEAHECKEYVPNENTMISSNGILSERTHIYYHKNMVSAWRLCGKTMYTTDHGVMTEVPYTDIKKLIRKQGYDYPKQSPMTIQKITDKFLAKVGCYVIEAEDGSKSFVESENPMVEIEIYIKNVLRHWLCPKCKNAMEADDDEDYSEKECLKCKNKGLVRIANINLEKNMNRIKRLVEMTEASNGKS